MKRIHRTILCCAVALAAVSLAAIASPASAGKKKGFSGTLSIGELATQFSERASQWSRYPLEMLGIEEIECTCSITIGEDERSWLFQAEPEIKGVDRDGPARGKLKKGDVIVAIDGMLITTRKAGVRFANLVAGDPVELTVRRSGRTHAVTVVPRAALEPAVPIDFTMHRSDLAHSVTIEPRGDAMPELARSIEELSKSAIEIGKRIRESGVPAVPIAPDRTFNINFGEMLPEGWVGFGLMFDGSITDNDEDELARWRFNEPPSIKSVHPGSPADKAGLQVNDVLLEIDGLKLDSRKGGDRFSRMLPGQVVEWKVRRGAGTFTVQTTTEERPAPEMVVVPPTVPVPADAPPFWYTGTVAGAEVEVRGSGDRVSVEVDEETGDIVVRTGDTVVRVKAKDKKKK